jgi:hypothetical protein
MGKFNAGVHEEAADEQKKDTQDTTFCECICQNKNLIQDI